MTALEQAIKDAVEKGGFIGEGDPEATIRVHGFVIFLDPSFWQALDRVRHWKIQGRKTENAWFLQWHRFIDALAEGRTAEDFFKSLM